MPEILVSLLRAQCCSLPVPAGRLLWTLPFLEKPCFPSSQPPRPPSTPAESSHPLFTHQGGCYSLWQQGPWQPASTWGKPHCCHGNRGLGRAYQLPGSTSLERDGEGGGAGGREGEMMGKDVGQAQAPHNQQYLWGVVLWSQGRVAGERQPSWFPGRAGCATDGGEALGPELTCQGRQGENCFPTLPMGL